MAGIYYMLCLVSIIGKLSVSAQTTTTPVGFHASSVKPSPKALQLWMSPKDVSETSLQWSQTALDQWGELVNSVDESPIASNLELDGGFDVPRPGEHKMDFAVRWGKEAYRTDKFKLNGHFEDHVKSRKLKADDKRFKQSANLSLQVLEEQPVLLELEAQANETDSSFMAKLNLPGNLVFVHQANFTESGYSLLMDYSPFFRLEKRLETTDSEAKFFANCTILNELNWALALNIVKQEDDLKIVGYLENILQNDTFKLEAHARKESPGIVTGNATLDLDGDEMEIDYQCTSMFTKDVRIRWGESEYKMHAGIFLANDTGRLSIEKDGGIILALNATSEPYLSLSGIYHCNTTHRTRVSIVSERLDEESGRFVVYQQENPMEDTLTETTCGEGESGSSSKTSEQKFADQVLGPAQANNKAKTANLQETKGTAENEALKMQLAEKEEQLARLHRVMQQNENLEWERLRAMHRQIEDLQRELTHKDQLIKELQTRHLSRDSISLISPRTMA
ncbi:unnamed protein product [Cyprideis torosa]|uniref:Uncharacterized protein n=1 Tax=Cyprideis torosa TaxID=163714 RepID=A0A7R8ZSS2_9CRUS|nr:unnamed protein product [Cyprideis torosa]CAG0896734.1 unnamed protein product [Cyprideis torosa]